MERRPRPDDHDLVDNNLLLNQHVDVDIVDEHEFDNEHNRALDDHHDDTR